MNGETYPLAVFFASYIPHPTIEEARFAVSRANDVGMLVGEVRDTSFLAAMFGAADLHKATIAEQLKRDGFALPPYAFDIPHVE